MPILSRTFIVIGGLSLVLANVLGAYGFHGLEGKIAPAELEAWQWAVQLHFLHSLGLILVAVLLSQAPRSILLRLAGGLMIAGLVLFSASIYARVLGAPAVVGQVAPLGGGSFMLAWLFTAIAGFRLRPSAIL